jgi:hypothetical protein
MRKCIDTILVLLHYDSYYIELPSKSSLLARIRVVGMGQ